MDTVILTQEQLNTVKKEWNKEYIGHYYEDECLCSFFQCFVEEVGYLALRIDCIKSSNYPSDMHLIVDNEVKIFNDSLCGLGHVPKEEQDGISQIGLLDLQQGNELREIVTHSIMRDYTAFGTDEYGNDANEGEYE